MHGETVKWKKRLVFIKLCMDVVSYVAPDPAYIHPIIPQIQTWRRVKSWGGRTSDIQKFVFSNAYIYVVNFCVKCKTNILYLLNCVSCYIFDSFIWIILKIKCSFHTFFIVRPPKFFTINLDLAIFVHPWPCVQLPPHFTFPLNVKSR